MEFVLVGSYCMNGERLLDRGGSVVSSIHRESREYCDKSVHQSFASATLISDATIFLTLFIK
jgi:hypothetical protein